MQRSATGDLIRFVGVLTLGVVFALALLYAYRSQTPAIQTIPMTQAIADIQGGRVDRLLLENDRATLTYYDGSRQQTFVGSDRDPLLRAVTEYDRAHPASDVQVRYDDRWPFGTTLVSVVLGLVPLAFLVAFVLFAAYVFARARRGAAYEQLSRIADLRDRGVLSEDEFQREKRRLLR